MLNFTYCSIPPPDTLWTQTYGGEYNERAHSVQQTSDGGYIVAGVTWSYGAGSGAFWLVKTDGNGNEDWTQTYGIPGSDYANSIKQTADGGYIIAGDTGSYGAGSCDFWLVRLSAETDSEDDIISIDPFQLSNHPNPFNPETTISFSIPTDSAINLIVYNIKGQLIKSLVNEIKPIGEHTVIWDGRDDNGKPVSSGIYFYKLKTNNIEKTRKMILMK
ncbi:MAG: FlgD immunoglobulin-like domain containing protein [Candidatus Tenebribacter burtonii]|nr:FlgD immunoglobulin-like domain containing protein [Candidatus Tenebribacter burtonii]